MIQVPPSKVPVGTSEGKYKRRAINGHGEPQCIPFLFQEMQAIQSSRGIMDYSSFEVPDAQWDDLNPLEFERFRKTIRESRGPGDESLIELSDLEVAKALNTVKANRTVEAVRVSGLLLFGREHALNRFLPTHEIAFQVVSGTKVLTNEFFRYPLLKAMEELLIRFRARNHEEEILDGILRIGIPDYSERAFREGIANALIHRDYSLQGAVHVQWHDDQMEITNPGSFPEGVRLDNLLITPPRPRNPLLADAFKRVGIVERTGRGIDTIFYEQLKNGRPAPSYDKSTETGVVLTIPGGEANLAFVRLVIEENRAGRILSVDDLLLLNSLRMEPSLNVSEASKLIQRSDTETRSKLGRLIEAGLIETRGSGRRKTYLLSASVYRKLGEKAAYIRFSGFESLQLEQMVMQYIEAHGFISRAETVSLCKLSRDQAYRLLQKLKDKELITMTKSHGRGVRYIKSAK